MYNGQLFDEKYRIVATLGKGGTSTVYLAQNVKLGTLWAIKQLNKEQNKKMNLLVEPNILKRLNHPALPRIFDIVEDEYNIYIVEDFIEGVSLDKEIVRNGKYEEERVISWVVQICDVLRYLHSSTPSPIIFRDLKPSNIILTNDDKIKLIDFGIAREYKKDSISDTVCMGTRGYAAPEQFLIGKQTDARADIFSLGVTIYTLLSGNKTGDDKFVTDSIKDSNDSISEEMKYVIKKCTELEPEKRFQTVDEIICYLNSRGKTNGAVPETALLQGNDLDNSYSDNSYINNSDSSNGNLDNNCLYNSNVVNSNSDSNNLDNNKSKKIYMQFKMGQKPIIFKKLILAIINDAKFSAELAYIVAKLTAFNILLINLDFNSDPSLFLGLDRKLKKSNNQEEQGFGLAPFMDFSSVSEYNHISLELFKGLSISRRDTQNLHLITDLPCYENKERYKGLDVKLILEWAYKYYDITLVLINGSPYDEHAVQVSEKADCILIPFIALADKVFESIRYMEYMRDKHYISNARYKTVAIDYKKGIHIPEKKLRQILPSYIGNIEYLEQREEFRALNEDFCEFVPKEFSSDYERILSSFNIVFEKKFNKSRFAR